MLDTTTEAGGRAERRLREEQIIWMTTVRSDAQQQSVPVWFFWDGETFLVYSQPDRQKLRNIESESRASCGTDAGTPSTNKCHPRIGVPPPSLGDYGTCVLALPVRASSAAHVPRYCEQSHRRDPRGSFYRRHPLEAHLLGIVVAQQGPKNQLARASIGTVARNEHRWIYAHSKYLSTYFPAKRNALHIRKKGEM